MDLGTSVLEGRNVLSNWAMDIGGMVGGGGGGKLGEAEDILGAIASYGAVWPLCKCPGQTVTAIAQAPTPALPCVTDVNVEGYDGKAVVVHVTVFVTVVVPGGGQGRRWPLKDVCCRVKGWQLETWCVVEDNF